MDPPSNSSPSVKNLKLKNPFKAIFFLFKITSLVPITFKRNSSCKTKLLSLYSIVILICFILPNLRHLEVVTVNLVLNTTSATLVLMRLLLGLRVRRLQSLALHLQQLRGSNSSNTPRWIKAWGATSMVLHIFLLVVIFLQYMEAGFVSNPVLKAALSLFLAIVTEMVVILPINTFAIFYVIVCRHVRSDIEEFATSLSEGSPLWGRDFGALLRPLRSIRRRVGLVDDELSLLMFCYVLLSSLITFVTISFLITNPILRSLLVKLNFLTNFAVSQASFLAMTASASTVSEAAGRLAEVVEGLPEVGRHRPLGADEQRFLAAARGEMTLTVWKIVPIRRNFIIGTTGAIFTYVILIDGFLRVNTSG